MYGWLDTRGTGSAVFMHAQCGLCTAYGRGYRTRTRMLAAADPSVLVTLLDALAEAPSARERVPCPLALKLARRRAMSPGAPAIEAVAALQVVLASEKLFDDRLDRDRLLARVASRLLAGDVVRAEATLVGLGFPLEELRATLRRQAELEARGDSDLDALAAPTGDALALAAGWLARRVPADEVAAATFARRLGRLLYVVDALQDLPRDRRTGAFNPLATLLASPSPATLGYLRDKVEGLVAALAEAFDALPLHRHAAPLRQATVATLARRAREALP